MPSDFPSDVLFMNSSSSNNNNDLRPLTDVGDNYKPAKAFPLGECEGDCDDDTECGQLVYMANYGVPVTNYPLKACQGDCDYDYDCDFGLSCWQRNDLEEVPGCLGSGRSGIDYCYQPSNNNTLVLYAVAGAPIENYPLQKCQGDCRSDTECSPGLSCLVRNGTEAIPGCVGDGVASFGYCYNPADGIFSTTTTTNATNSTNNTTSILV
jgi:hypothetical protein